MGIDLQANWIDVCAANRFILEDDHRLDGLRESAAAYQLVHVHRKQAQQVEANPTV
jgi:hypothetical protein